MAVKVAFVGDSAVGKTSLICRLLGQDIPCVHLPTRRDVAYNVERSLTPDSQKKVRFIDTSTERCQNDTPLDGLAASFAVVVFSVKDRSSFDTAKRLLQSFGRKVVLLVGNEADKQDRGRLRQVSVAKGTALACCFAIEYVETSALEKTGLCHLNEQLAKIVQAHVACSTLRRQMVPPPSSSAKSYAPYDHPRPHPIPASSRLQAAGVLITITRDDDELDVKQREEQDFDERLHPARSPSIKKSRSVGDVREVAGDTALGGGLLKRRGALRQRSRSNADTMPRPAKRLLGKESDCSNDEEPELKRRRSPLWKNLKELGKSVVKLGKRLNREIPSDGEGENKSKPQKRTSSEGWTHTYSPRAEEAKLKAELSVKKPDGQVVELSASSRSPVPQMKTYLLTRTSV